MTDPANPEGGSARIDPVAAGDPDQASAAVVRVAAAWMTLDDIDERAQTVFPAASDASRTRRLSPQGR